MNTLKKLLSPLLSIALVFSLVPTTALAEPLSTEPEPLEVEQNPTDKPADEQSQATPAASLTTQGVETSEYNDGTVTYTYAMLNDVTGQPRLTILKVAVNDQSLEAASLNLTIPSTIQVNNVNTPVEALGNGDYGLYTFGDGNGGINKANLAIGSITIPASVRTVGEHFFGSRTATQGCTNVTSITFAEDSPITAIPNDCFSHLTKLQSVALPAGITSIGDEAFRHCESLATVTYAGGDTTGVNLPATLEFIGERAFQDCASFSSVTVPEGVTSIGAYAFANVNMTEYEQASNSQLASVTLPNSLKTIGDKAFYQCETLTSVTLGTSMTDASLETIGANAFATTSITSAAIPDTVTTIADGAFDTKSTLTTLQLGSSQATSHLQSIGTNAFRNARITEIALPNTLQSLGYDASDTRGRNYWKTPFAGCTQLTTIAWPTSSTEGCFTTVGGFWGCPKLTPDVMGSIPPWITTIDDHAFDFESGQNQWTDASITIPATIEYLGAAVFSTRSTYYVNNKDIKLKCYDTTVEGTPADPWN